MIRTLGIAAAVFAAGLMIQTARAADEKGAAFFEGKIRPILAQNCVGCHGPDKQKGGLRLDTREGLLAGGNDDGKPIKVYDAAAPEKSLIIEAVEYKNDKTQMPPPKKDQSRKLTDEQIESIRQWIKMGAPYAGEPVKPIKAG